MLALPVDGLRVQDDHPDVALGEVAALLDGGQKLLVVQVAIAEIPAEHDSCDELAVGRHVFGLVIRPAQPWDHPVQSATMRVHCPERHPLVHQKFGDLRSV